MGDLLRSGTPKGPASVLSTESTIVELKYFLFVICYLLFVICYLLFVICYWPIDWSVCHRFSIFSKRGFESTNSNLSNTTKFTLLDSLP